MGFFSDIGSAVGATFGGVPGFFAGQAAGGGIDGMRPNPNDPLSYLAGRPKPPEYVNPEAYVAPTKSSVDYGTLNTDALNKLRGIGMSDQESPWAAMKRQELERSSGLGADQIRANADNALAKSNAALSSRYGLSGGAAERNANAQGASMQEQLQRLGSDKARLSSEIGTTDYQNRMNVLSALPGQELAAMSPRMQQENMNAQLAQQGAAGQNAYNTGANTALNQYNQTRYGQDLGAWGQMANAQALAANKPKGFFESMLPWNWS